MLQTGMLTVAGVNIEEEASEFISETSLLWILTVLFFDYSFLFTGTQIALW